MKNKIIDLIVGLFVMLLEITLIVFAGIELATCNANPDKEYLIGNIETSTTKIKSLMIWAIIGLSLLTALTITYIILKIISMSKNKEKQTEKRRITIIKNYNISVKQIFYYISFLTLLILGCCSMFMWFLITIMPIPQILFIINIIITICLSNSIKTDKIIKAISKGEIGK